MARTRSMLAVGALVAASGTGLVVAAATAQPPPGQVPAHQHFLELDDGRLVPVGPDVCDDPDGSIQFDNFHINGHVGVPGAKLGLIVGRPCSFVPPG